MLGRLEMDVDECIQAYIKLMKDVFASKSSSLPINWRLKVKARFSSKKLKNAIEGVVAKKGVSPSALLDDKNDHGSRT